MDPRGQTFITIHNLTPEANILFASDSLFDVLGYQPDEVSGKSAFDYFHPEEVPFARSFYSRGVLFDKAAVIHYARILSRSGQWISCECCFTVVHNVLVASISPYFRSKRSERRARDAAQIRRIFSSSSRDSRSHMLEHLSPKLKMPLTEREPRAALILNRFTRNLTIMYATDAIAQILGLHSDELLEKPFYQCIQPKCRDEAERCLESAKANESIAYLRFWYKDPRVVNEEKENETEMESEGNARSSLNDNAMGFKDPSLKDNRMDIRKESDPRVRRSDVGGGDEDRGPLRGADASTSWRHRSQAPQTFELEAVVSCTSDGLVVVLRRARPPGFGAQLSYENGLFTAPWALQPIEPCISPEMLYTFCPPLLPQYMPLREDVRAAGGPPLDQLMRSIRDVAVFAWAVTGINPNLVDYGHGRRRIGGQAVDGLTAREPNNSCQTMYPPSDDLSVDRTSDFPKDPSTAAADLLSHYPSETPFYTCRTRHMSVDNAYEPSSRSIRPAGWPTAPSPSSLFRSTSLSSSYDCEETDHNHHHHHHCRPPLQDVSYGAPPNHARHHRQQRRHQQQGYMFAALPASSSASRRCNPGDEPWKIGAERNGKLEITEYAGVPWGASSSLSTSASCSLTESSGSGGRRGVICGGGGGQRGKRYYW